MLIVFVAIDDPKMQKDLWDWRKGIFGWGKKCICGIRFDRGHVQCMEKLGLFDDILSVSETDFMDLDKALLPLSTKYTIIDYLLNIGGHNRAYQILVKWNKILSKHFLNELALP